MQTYSSEAPYIIRGRVDRSAITVRSDDRGPQRRARGLGWFSLGLGLAEVFAAERLGKLAGFPVSGETRRTMFGFGLREIGAGVGLLRGDRPSRWMWSRFAGDLMDLAFLGSAFGLRKADRGRLAVTTAAIVGITLLDAITARQLEQCGTNLERRRVEHTSAVTIHRSPLEVENAWASFKTREPSKHGEAQFRLAPGGRGTEVRLGHGKLAGRLCESKLRRFKQLVEIGEIVQSDASVHRGPHPAQPSRAEGTKGKDWLR